MQENNVLTISNLWDEIPKAIVYAMPEQLFPIFKEVYGRDYPAGTPIRILSTEYSTYLENPDAPPGSILADIALLVDGTDFYHIECQMKNDSEMIIRFPHSVVIYPDKNASLPDKLRCKIIFQDNSEHIYEIPTLKVQSYTLREIHEKHLMFFIPFVLLRLRPKLKNKHSLTINELTGFVQEVILILQDELNNGNLSESQYNDYLNLFRDSANYIFANYPEHRKEIAQMTEPKIILPSMIEKRLRAEIAMLTEQVATIPEKNAALAEKDAEISALTELVATIADKDAEIVALKEQLQQLTYT